MSLPSVPLGEVCEIIMGQAPKGETYNTNGDGLPLVGGASDFGVAFPKPKKFTSAPTKISKPGDIILSIRATIGPKVEADGQYCLGRGVAALRAKSRLDRRYLWHWLTQSTNTLLGKARGATFLQVSSDDIKSLPLPLPPLEEQRRIAAILDKADALRQKRKQAIALLDSLTQSIFLEMFGDPISNPRGLGCVALEDVAEFQGGATPSKDRTELWGGDIPWVSPKDMKRLVIDTSLDTVSASNIESGKLKEIPASSTLLVIRGMILAHTVPIAIAKRAVTINQDMKAVIFASMNQTQVLAG